MRMRQVLVLFSVAALAIGAADAALGSVPILLRTPGAELVELRHGNGRAAVTGEGGRSLVQVDRARSASSISAGRGRPEPQQPVGGVLTV